MLLKYGAPSSDTFVDKVKKSDCPIRFAIHRFTSMRGGPWLNDKSDKSDISGQVATFVSTHHLPFAKSVGSLKALLARSVAEGEPCPWVASNTVIRSAQIAFLAKEIGQTADVVRKAIRLHAKNMRSVLAPSIEPYDYIEAVIKDAGLA
jgi:hypothetical protein